MTLTHRYIARIVLEAETGLFVGSGEASLLKDALVQKDHHGLPMIQGTSLAGVLRHSIEKSHEDKKVWEELFGFQEKNAGMGSRLRVSSAYMMINKTSVAEGLNPDIEKIKDRYENLPSRQHVRITEKGVAQDTGLFDNEIVYKGSRFLFELELKGTKEDAPRWETLLSTLSSPLFRIGHGTRNGYGKLKVLTLRTKAFDLTTPVDFEAYLHFDPSFNASNSCLKEANPGTSTIKVDTYKLHLEPDSFFIFGKGAGDDEADNIPVEEEVAMYTTDTIQFIKQTLIPASSIKGALAHRTAFHFNKLNHKYIDRHEGDSGKDNPAVSTLFGFESEGSKEKKGHRGRVILDDLYYSSEKVNNDKIFNHVAIDRFTGGAMDGALFSEKVSVVANKGTIEFTVYLERIGADIDQDIRNAFEEALIDVCKGLLPLGGMTTKGHGIFTGKVIKNNNPTPLFDYDTF